MVPMRTAMLVRAVVHVPDWPPCGWAGRGAVRLGGRGAVRLGGALFGWAGLAAFQRT